jgi:uroporphyrinogen III methyltransferase/synthase
MNREPMTMKPGKVYLIGAGPGDPKLITLRGKEYLERAQVVIYDYLAPKELLDFVRPGTEVIFAGKSGGNCPMTQEGINRLIIEKALSGKIVARLKGGDPFIFGRGGEEAEALVQAGIPFEVVPGVTAAIAVPAYAGIPLTHRDLASTVAFVTGHEDPTKGDSFIDWETIATGIGTLVFFMGMARLPEIVKNLIQYGRDPKTPVALIRWGTRLTQKTVQGTLNDIVEKARVADLKPPVTIVVGEVVRLRDRLSWFETRPLFGRKILVTRARDQASEFSDLLAQNGAEPIEFPTIEVAPPKSFRALDQAIQKLSQYHWLIFTSVNGVQFFIERLRAVGKDIRALDGLKICAIGPRTAEEIRRFGIDVDLVPEEYQAEGVIAGMGRRGLKGKRILLPRAAVAREILPVELRRLGARVDVVTAYRTVKPTRSVAPLKKLLQAGEISVITFTSSSTVRNFAEMFGKRGLSKLLGDVKIACIGPITAETAKELGIKTDIMPEDSTIPAFVEAIGQHFEKKR